MSEKRKTHRRPIMYPLFKRVPNSRSWELRATRASSWIFLILIFTVSNISKVAASISESPKFMIDDMIQKISRGIRMRTTLTQSTPVLRPTLSTKIRSSDNYSNSCQNNRRNLMGEHDSLKTVSSVKVKANKTKVRIRNMLQYAGSTGFYYGIDPERMIPKGDRQGKARPPKLQDSMVLALEELKMLRLEMAQMRTEIQQLKRGIIGDNGDDYIDNYSSPETKAKALRKRQTDAEILAAEIESWATAIFEEGEEDGWKPVECSKVIRASMNGVERTTVFMKWMVDPRGEKADKEDLINHPCIKCFSTIDAPIELVCAYLSQPEMCPKYNDVVDNFEDLEDISPRAKICWSSSPQILFVKPRDFITFCSHRWKSDGTQVIVNQACEHPKFPLNMEKKGKSCRGYALRGANFISRCSEDPSKTKIAIIAHCRPGGGLPDWATKTAVKALAPIEPFKLFHKINDQIIQNQDRLERLAQEAKKKGSKPGGFAQIGYACFWPNGGGEEADAASTEQPMEVIPEGHEENKNIVNGPLTLKNGLSK